MDSNSTSYHRKVDAMLPGKGKSNSHGARPVHPIITDSDQQVVNKEVSLLQVCPDYDGT
jgi:hypothetical protein